MAKIKKQGLDYFPFETHFLQNRLVRRLMKCEGDGAFAVLMGAYSCIYDDEGYFVRADDYFYDDLAAGLYEKTPDDVRRIIALTVDYGFFDARLFREEGILTAADIQRQYLHSTTRRRRTADCLDPRYRLLDDDGEEHEEKLRPAPTEAPPATGKTAPDCEQTQRCTAKCSSTGENAAKTPQNATFIPHSIAQHSIEKHSIAPPLLNPPPGEEAADAARKATEEEYRQKIARLQLPRDGLRRNPEGLLLNLAQHRIPPREQYAIILKSNFGIIGHPLWRGFEVLRTSHGKIRQPGRYLLSLCT